MIVPGNQKSWKV